MVRIEERLPFWLQQRWRKRAVDTLDARGTYPKVNDLIKFVAKAAKEANDPMFGTMASGNRAGNSNGRDGVSVPVDKGRQRGKGSNFNTTMTTKVNEGHVTKETSPGANQSTGYRMESCPMCSGQHNLFNCLKFKESKPEDRLKFTRSKRLCDNCLKGGHFAADCRLNRRCTVCDKKHTKFLHLPIDQRTSAPMKGDGNSRGSNG
jgi:hypothetical protein